MRTCVSSPGLKPATPPAGATTGPDRPAAAPYARTMRSRQGLSRPRVLAWVLGMVLGFLGSLAPHSLPGGVASAGIAARAERAAHDSHPADRSAPADLEGEESPEESAEESSEDTEKALARNGGLRPLHARLRATKWPVTHDDGRSAATALLRPPIEASHVVPSLG